MTKYNLSAKELNRVKQCAKFAGLNWQAIASRPSTAMQFCDDVENERKKLLGVKN